MDCICSINNHGDSEKKDVVLWNSLTYICVFCSFTFTILYEFLMQSYEQLLLMY